MTARTPPTMKAVAMRIINIGVFIAASTTSPEAAEFSSFKMNQQ
jgi:hypothetical protein